jgi:hypothetical protein
LSEKNRISALCGLVALKWIALPARTGSGNRRRDSGRFCDIETPFREKLPAASVVSCISPTASRTAAPSSGFPELSMSFPVRAQAVEEVKTTKAAQSILFKRVSFERAFLKHDIGESSRARHGHRFQAESRGFPASLKP